MKSLLAFLATTFLVFASPLIAKAQTDSRGFIVSVGDMMPDFDLADLNGQVHTNESLLGQVYVLQFTASWCSVCRAEMPHLESEVWQEFQDRDFMLTRLFDKEEFARMVETIDALTSPE